MIRGSDSAQPSLTASTPSAMLKIGSASELIDISA